MTFIPAGTGRTSNPCSSTLPLDAHLGATVPRSGRAGAHLAQARRPPAPHAHRISTTPATRHATPTTRFQSSGWTGTPSSPSWSITSEAASWPAMKRATVVALAEPRGRGQRREDDEGADHAAGPHPPGCGSERPPVRRAEPADQHAGHHRQRADRDGDQGPVDRVARGPGDLGVDAAAAATARRP